MPDVHSKFPPSSAKRHLSCTASYILEQGFKDETSEYAAEGSAGHSMAEHLLKKFLKLRSKRPVSDYFSDELLEAVDDYVSIAQEAIVNANSECEDSIILVEQRVNIPWVKDADCFGTCDLAVITDKKIRVFDLKLGKGVMVDAAENYQLMIYGLGMLNLADNFFDGIETVEMTIVQPRLSHYSTWEMTVDDLKGWASGFLASKSHEAITGENAVFSPGDDNCRFCKARHTCKARVDYYMQIAAKEFRNPDLLTDDEMAEVLSKCDGIKKWVEDVYSYAQNEAITNGKEWPGFKLVCGKSNRKYADEAKVVVALKKAGYNDIYEQSLIGIGKMEKYLSKTKFKELLEDSGLVIKPEGKLSLVGISDKREAVKVNSVADSFTEVKNYE